MIAHVLKINWLNLKRDYIVLGLSFLLPLLFFSVFALVFGRMGPNSKNAKPLDIILIDQDQTEISRWLVTAIDQQPALRIVSGHQPSQDQRHRQLAPSVESLDGIMRQLRSGDQAIAVVIPKGFGHSFTTPTPEPIDIIYDAANPFARFVVSGVLQGTVLTASPSIILQKGMLWLDRVGQSLSPAQRQAVETLRLYLQTEQPWKADSDSTTATVNPPDAATPDTNLIPVRTTNVMGEEKDMVSYYAAGIGVMFILFSMAGAGGSLLTEQESGTLERLLNSNLTMSQLLMGKWIFFVMLATSQLLLMFVWGSLFFGLDLWSVNRFAGFLAMTLVTAAAAAAFGVVLATLCTSRAQLSALATAVIVVMSALGGSMAPRFAMPDFMDTVSKFTLNGWALDGFLKVFWYNDPGASLIQSLASLWLQLVVLIMISIIFLSIANILSRRWETV